MNPHAPTLCLALGGETDPMSWRDVAPQAGFRQFLIAMHAWDAPTWRQGDALRAAMPGSRWLGLQALTATNQDALADPARPAAREAAVALWLDRLSHAASRGLPLAILPAVAAPPPVVESQMPGDIGLQQGSTNPTEERQLEALCRSLHALLKGLPDMTLTLAVGAPSALPTPGVWPLIRDDLHDPRLRLWLDLDAAWRAGTLEDWLAFAPVWEGFSVQAVLPGIGQTAADGPPLLELATSLPTDAWRVLHLPAATPADPLLATFLRERLQEAGLWAPS